MTYRLPRRRRFSRRTLLIGGVVIAALAAWFLFHGSSREAGKSAGASHGGGGKNAPVPVGVATAKTGDISVYLDGLGTITPRSTVVVHTLVNGQLMSVLFNEGQLVKKNDLLAKIDDRPFIAALEQAQGTLARDQALLATAKLDFERYRLLWKQDSIAKQQLDTQASLVKQDEGNVLNDQGALDTAKVNLAYTKITSPVNGRVGLRQVDAGNIVHSSDTNGLVVVTELQPITALFTLPEDSLPDVLKHRDGGDRLVAEAWDRDGKHKLATGLLTAIDNEVDPTTGMVKFRAEFANEDNSLFPSQFVNIRLKLETLHDAVTIPNAAVQRGTHGSFVYLVKDEKPDDATAGDDKGDKDAKSAKEAKPVKDSKIVAVQNVALGPAEGETVSVTQGVSAGDEMVVDGADALRDGAKIQIATKDGVSLQPPKGEGREGGKTGADVKDASAADAAGSTKPSHRHRKEGDNADKIQAPK